uniref:Uncharacterized protein n=1 Tax=Arundo donax TaxID=35708 RepID=A0A0A9DQK3_ARUDO
MSSRLPTSIPILGFLGATRVPDSGGRGSSTFSGG